MPTCSLASRARPRESATVYVRIVYSKIIALSDKQKYFISPLGTCFGKSKNIDQNLVRIDIWTFYVVFWWEKVEDPGQNFLISFTYLEHIINISYAKIKLEKFKYVAFL